MGDARWSQHTVTASGEEDIGEMRKWFASGHDVRNDQILRGGSLGVLRRARRAFDRHA